MNLEEKTEQLVHRISAICCDFVHIEAESYSDEDLFHTVCAALLANLSTRANLMLPKDEAHQYVYQLLKSVKKRGEARDWGHAR